jgi:putative FmdB family regulatory protein
VPTYEYQCDKCGRVFEIRQRISEAPLTTCAACGGRVRRLLSAAPFILKGKGWYVTDYPSESRKKAQASEKSSAGGDGKSAEGHKAEKTETKAEKTETKDDGAAKTTTKAPAPPSSPSPPSSASSD